MWTFTRSLWGHQVSSLLTSHPSLLLRPVIVTRTSSRRAAIRQGASKLQVAAAIAQQDAAAAAAAGPVDIVGPVVAPGQTMTQTGGKKKAVGALQRVPVVAPPDEHLASALKRASRVVGSASIKNDADKERNRAARQMDTLMKELSGPLTRYLGGFPTLESLHPFEQALLQLTVGGSAYTGILRKVKALRKSVQEVGKAYAGRAASAPNKQAATLVALEGMEAMEKLFHKSSSPVAALKEVGKQLRRLPYVDPTLPTLALVGAPNVGKSSLVRVLSSGVPEVCNYPFTTRTIKMGHFYVDGGKHQVTDTPGLLDRGDDDRNSMEHLTLAALDYLPSMGVFVMDLTEECGTSAVEQWEIRRELLARFPHKQWLDVLTKSDLLEDVFSRADALTDSTGGQSAAASAAAAAAAAVPLTPGALPCGSPPSLLAASPQLHPSSPSTSPPQAPEAQHQPPATAGPGSAHLTDCQQQQQQQQEGAGGSGAASARSAAELTSSSSGRDVTATSVRGVDSPAESTADSTPPHSHLHGGAGVEVADPVDVAMQLRGALRVSSLTESGLEELKRTVMNMLRGDGGSREPRRL